MSCAASGVWCAVRKCVGESRVVMVHELRYSLTVVILQASGLCCCEHPKTLHLSPRPSLAPKWRPAVRQQRLSSCGPLLELPLRAPSTSLRSHV